MWEFTVLLSITKLPPGLSQIYAPIAVREGCRLRSRKERHRFPTSFFFFKEEKWYCILISIFKIVIKLRMFHIFIAICF